MHSKLIFNSLINRNTKLYNNVISCFGGGCGSRVQELACSLLALYESGKVKYSAFFMKLFNYMYFKLMKIRTGFRDLESVFVVLVRFTKVSFG